MKRTEVINLNYQVACMIDVEHHRLQRAFLQHEKPWIVLGPETAAFHTHAEAIQYADKLARGAK